MDAQAKQRLFRSELRKAMERLESSGISYPQGYYEKLLEKYPAFRYPRIVARVGKPNIREHPAYGSVLESRGMLLDYGCGTGDDIRALISGGYPKGRIKGFDITWDCINLGFDLYGDRKELEGIFVVSDKFPFGRKGFDFVYSGSVLHGFESEKAVMEYLENARKTLKERGMLFGSTLGNDKPLPKGYGGSPPMPLTEKQLRSFLEGSGFRNPEISMTENEIRTVPKYRLWFSGVA